MGSTSKISCCFLFLGSSCNCKPHSFLIVISRSGAQSAVVERAGITPSKQRQASSSYQCESHDPPPGRELGAAARLCPCCSWGDQRGGEGLLHLQLWGTRFSDILPARPSTFGTRPQKVRGMQLLTIAALQAAFDMPVLYAVLFLLFR